MARLCYACGPTFTNNYAAILISACCMVFSLSRIICIFIWGQWVLNESKMQSKNEAVDDCNELGKQRDSEFEDLEAEHGITADLNYSCEVGFQESSPLGFLWAEIAIEIFMSINAIFLLAVACNTPKFPSMAAAWHWIVMLSCCAANIMIFATFYPGKFLNVDNDMFGILSIVIFSIKYLLLILMSLWLWSKDDLVESYNAENGKGTRRLQTGRAFKRQVTRSQLKNQATTASPGNSPRNFTEGPSFSSKRSLVKVTKVKSPTIGSNEVDANSDNIKVNVRPYQPPKPQIVVSDVHVDYSQPKNTLPKTRFKDENSTIMVARNYNSLDTLSEDSTLCLLDEHSKLRAEAGLEERPRPKTRRQKYRNSSQRPSTESGTRFKQDIKEIDYLFRKNEFPKSHDHSMTINNSNRNSKPNIPLGMKTVVSKRHLTMERAQTTGRYSHDSSGYV